MKTKWHRDRPLVIVTLAIALMSGCAGYGDHVEPDDDATTSAKYNSPPSTYSESGGVVVWSVIMGL